MFTLSYLTLPLPHRPHKLEEDEQNQEKIVPFIDPKSSDYPWRCVLAVVAPQTYTHTLKTMFEPL